MSTTWPDSIATEPAAWAGLARTDIAVLALASPSTASR